MLKQGLFLTFKFVTETEPVSGNYRKLKCRVICLSCVLDGDIKHTLGTDFLIIMTSKISETFLEY